MVPECSDEPGPDGDGSQCGPSSHRPSHPWLGHITLSHLSSAEVTFGPDPIQLLHRTEVCLPEVASRVLVV